MVPVLLGYIFEKPKIGATSRIVHEDMNLTEALLCFLNQPLSDDRLTDIASHNERRLPDCPDSDASALQTLRAACVQNHLCTFLSQD
jgi:hypothetical protein